MLRESSGRRSWTRTRTSVRRNLYARLTCQTDADGTIPVVMEERLIQIGDFLKVNGDAIYGTKPWKKTRQWGGGEQPKIEYNKEYSTAYDVTKLAGKPAAGKAGIESFFTAKGNAVYAILPRWPGKTFLLKDVAAAKSVTLLGGSGPLKFKPGKDGLSVMMPELPEELMQQPAWVLKVSQ